MIKVDEVADHLKDNFNIEITGTGSDRKIKFQSGKEGAVLISRRTNPRDGNTQSAKNSDYQIFINPSELNEDYSRVFIIDEHKAKEYIGSPRKGAPVTLNSSKKITINYPHAKNPQKNKEYWDSLEGDFNENREDGVVYYGLVQNPEPNQNLNLENSIDDLENAYSEILDIHTNIIVEGVAGSGKSHMLQGLRSSGAYGENGNRIDVVVFHPSTSYEEFVSGVRPNFTKQEGEGDFVTYEGVFVQMCNRAAQDPENRYLLFIDEINRANTSRVFGDLMLVLEKTKRQSFEGLSTEGRDGALFEASVETMPGEYVRLQTPIIKNSKEYNKLAVPSNLHVLGTMNTTDRSVGTIDLALRRRFHWITQEPYTAEELKEAMGDEYPGIVASWYEKANGILLTKVGPDARLGHAYFFGKDGDEEAIAEALITQLLEIIFTFNIKDNVLQEIGVPPIPQYAGKKLGYRGESLGRRPSIDNSQSSATPQAEESALENSGDDSVSENQ